MDSDWKSSEPQAESEPSDLHSFTRDDLLKAIDLLAIRSNGAEFIVVGSQAILAHLDPELLTGIANSIVRSNDIDVFADPALSIGIQIDLQFHFGPDSEFSLENSWEIEPVGEMGDDDLTSRLAEPTGRNCHTIWK